MITLPKVDLRANESQEQMLRRFNKSVIKSKMLADIRRKRWFVSKSELKRIEKKKAIRRQNKVQRPTGPTRRFQGTSSSNSSQGNSRSFSEDSNNSYNNRR